ncbi:mechanosensitive ion channel family protein [Rhizobium ruizarguesonis]|jgi:small-conductance mechanosensitive channel|uniref:Mechanosensitive ion channel n=2 Tax=Rhizobium TaxID=379 RepID=A0AAE8QFU5_9HYPH|nr:mechanosensitive ion channel family protein [Rhizobium ruizarguesonis]MBY5806605.1 mechanosensitive ion channel family protein [Rhizobium leguminosarum]NKL11143.1 mechanosensitive ion channel [Rhizobium leguminosarum bv. viciae]QIO43099.1 mechanosensitive ion channel family protein [Rhizobium leguminosarum bv. trifolii]QJS28126.1 mechanosensitive ion channel family protein [Rhizobium leguminosarum bv. trifolii TA1]MBY5833391.1 mechanosensitive ion channel family protein [Rhizobium leguminos
MPLLCKIRMFKPLLTAVALGSVLLCASIAVAQSVTPASPQPESVQRFIGMFSDPDVQRFLQQQSEAAKTAAEPPLETRNADPSFSEFTMRFRAHASSLLGAIQSFPQETMRGGAVLERDIQANGGTRPIFLVAAFVAVGLAAQWLFWWISAGWRSWMARAPYATVRERVIALTARLLWAACYVLSFGLGSIGFFLLFQWPPVIREVVVGYLFAIVVFRLASALFDVFLAPRAEEESRFRVVPITGDAAGHWAKRLGYLVGWYAFGWVTIRLLGALGFSDPARQLVAYCLGLVLLVIGIEAVWRRPSRLSAGQASRIGLRARNWLWTVYFVAVWLLWVVGAMKLFWIAVVCAALPGAIALTKASVDNILRSSAAEEDGHKRGTVVSVIVERGIRAALIVGAIVLLADALGIRLTQMTMQDSPALRLVRGLLSAGIILLVLDLAWNVVKVLIDRKLGDTEAVLEVGSERERRRTRIRTLLPILRNFLMILFVAIAIMMALSSLGVEIGPLIAGAGVVGVAIGFGAQTVVKDVISGMFYLLDDAFRVGEYIQSGSYKGTVESFSLRSIKLRHHRGAVYIVPFSELGAVQNMSRDWVIEKMTITITYDSDIDKARKIIKKIGLELFEDPEFKPTTIEPLKMQGIDSLGDSGLLLRMKVMTLPGQQFTLKRRALRMIHQAFNENGIKLAVPTVQVSGGKDDAVAAAAQQTLAAHNAAAAANPA